MKTVELSQAKQLSEGEARELLSRARALFAEGRAEEGMVLLQDVAITVADAKRLFPELFGASPPVH